ncbi:MAG: hypothetical protein H6835_04535 [Planctomycetes bacterium]|nr:hypothetical protein [Planctomycetota bacterium]
MRLELVRESAGEDPGQLKLTPIAVGRDGVAVTALPSLAPAEADGRMVQFRHGATVRERFELRAEGVELSWVFDTRPAGNGDLFVRYAVETALQGPVCDRDGVVFGTVGEDGVRIGNVFGVDADGARVRGAIRWCSGALELSLPAAFVDAARYPLVLDPLVGAAFAWSTVTTPIVNRGLDAVRDRSTGRTLFAFQHDFFGSTSVGYEIVDDQGISSGGATPSTPHPQSAPKVASWGTGAMFGLVYQEDLSSTNHALRLKLVSAATAGVVFDLVLGTSTAAWLHYDIGCESNAAVGSGRTFVVVAKDEATGGTKIYAIGLSGTAPSFVPSVTASSVIVTDAPLGSTYTQHALSKSAGVDGDLVLLMRRVNLTGDSIAMRRVRTDGTLPGSVQTLHFSSTDDVSVPDVDGRSGRWVAAWQQYTGGSSNSSVVVAPIHLDPAGILVAGAESTLGGTAVAQDSKPSVACSSAKAWVGMQHRVTLPSVSTSMRLASYDVDTCVSCNDTFTLPTSSSTDRVVVAPAEAGGGVGDTALAGYINLLGGWYNAWGQLLVNTANGGTVVMLSGGCGAAGSQSIPHPPAIGASQFTSALASAPPTALLSVFNLSPAGVGTLQCGSCVWVPFSVTATLPLVGGAASISFPIPCQPTLIGAQLETQWTTFDPTQASCPLVPGLVLSNIALLTFGQ